MEFLLTIVLILFVVGFLFSRLLPWLMRLWLKRVQKRFGNGPKVNREANPAPLQKKRIHQSEGDYIDFEEIV